MASSSIHRLRLRNSPRTLREEGLERLRKAIVNGTFSPGSRLVERQLCEFLGVSRSVIREVLRHLEAEGLVERPGREGPIVARISFEQLHELFYLLHLLQHDAVKLLLEKVKTDTKARTSGIERLDKLCKDQAEAANSSPEATNAFVNHYFETVFKIIDRPMSLEIVTRLISRIAWIRASTISLANRNKSVVEKLTGLTEQIKAGNEKAALEVLTGLNKEIEDIALHLIKTAKAA